MAHPVTWFQIAGPDDRALVRFYEKLFGWRTQSTPGEVGYHMVAPEAGGIAGGIGASRDGNASVSVYVDVDDLERTLKKIEAAGGKTALEPMDLPQGMGRIAGFYDPAGNWVGLWQPGKPAEVQAKPARKPAKTAPAKPKKKRAVPQAKKRTAPKPKKRTAPKPKKRTAPKAKRRTAPKPKKKAAPKPKKKAAPKAKRSSRPAKKTARRVANKKSKRR